MRKLVYCKIAVSLAAYSLFLLFLPSTSNAQTLQTVTRAGQSTPYCIRATGDSIGTVSGPGAELNYSGGIAYLNGLNRTTNTYIPLTIQASVVSTNTRLCVNGATDDGSSALQVKGDLAISGALGIIIDVDSTTGYTTRTCSLEPSPLETRTVRFNCSSTDPGGGWKFYNSNTSKSLMYVTQNGNIGVNTTHPLSTFSVEGTVTAQVLNITQTGWSDFVFDSTYQRMPLNQVAAYVHQYKHLPGIPSAGQIAASGLDIGAMQKLHMQKIEELTLDAIQADAHAKVQDSIIAQQQQTLNRQQALLELLQAQLQKQQGELDKIQETQTNH